MKCPNCGADLEINKEKKLRFCPYCGHKVEIKEEAPTTIAGAVSGIAKDILKQKAEREKYERENRGKNIKRTFISMIGFILLMASVPLVFGLVGKLLGLK